MGLETTAQIHYPYSAIVTHLKPINGPHFSQASKESLKKCNFAYGKGSPTGQKWTSLSEQSPRERIIITLVLEAGNSYSGFHVHQEMFWI